MKKQKIENIFSPMEDFSSVPPPELWAQIEEKLDKPKKKKRAILWWSAAACLLLGLMLPSILHFKALENKNFDLNTNDGTQKVVLDEKTPHPNPHKTESIKKNETKQQTRNASEKESIIVKEQLGNSSNSFNQQSSYVYSESDSKNNKDSKRLNSNAKIQNNQTKTNLDKKESLIVKEQLDNASNSFDQQSSYVYSESDSKNNKDSKRLNSNAKIQNNQTKSNLDKKESLIVKEQLGNSSNGFNQQSSYVYSESDSKNNKGSEYLNSNAKIQKQNTANSVTVVPDVNITAKNRAIAESNAANAKNKKTTPEIPAEKAVFGKTKGFNSSVESPFTNAFEEQKTASNIHKKDKNNSLKGNSNFGNPKTNSGSTIFGNTNNADNPYLALSPELNAGNKKASDPSKSSSKKETAVSEKALALNQEENAKNTSKFGEALTKQDSVQLAVLQNLEKGILTPEIIKDPENDKEDKKTTQKEKWAVALYAGVANSENYRNNKTLGSVNDSKQSSAYGVKTSYKINKKWAVGSGLKINELGQSVANVSYMNAKNTAFFTSSDFYNAQLSSADKITGNADFIFVPTNSQQLAASENIQSGNLDQNLRYIEMPLEVSYSIFNRNKASINLNTGGFVGKLISNTVTLDGQSLGQNINANDYVYGSTLSSTLQYRVYKKTNVFVEPAMNYYINPLNSQSFNQFQWGLNFGLNVSF
ncbi:hypothetical protein [Flavobacterium hungaricum]|uniref:Outer membrane protein beta-barrel domain-containing protein n=1 Tax=Flavobacterium hungaricum TaxID=2082725 RepID=A0ABR9TRX5_9FLAO|nr:hypothetical protein [Flavobacterium hungaricum]MBE8728071.1 hypothetical protein [Flavobacterium hungaricum]